MLQAHVQVYIFSNFEIGDCNLKVASSPCWSRFYSLLFNQNRFHWSRKEQRTGGYHSYLICILGRGGSPVLAPVCIRTTILVLKSSGIRQRRFSQLWVGIHLLSRLSCLALPCIPAMVAMCYTHQEHEALPDNGHADLDHYVHMHSAQQCKFHQKTSHKQRPVPAPSSGYAHPCRRNQTHPRLR